VKPAAILLAGGLGTRMGGGDKPLRDLAGRPILAHVIARIAPQAAATVLNANGDHARFAEWGLPIIADAIPDYPGPLAGIHAGMLWAQGHFAEVASVPTDTPFLPEDLIESLHDARNATNADIAVAASHGQTHPVAALWPVALADELYRFISAGGRRVTEFTAHYNVVHVDFPVVDIDPFFNINSPEDLEQAHAVARRLK
jgi:molybdopterin-guanine dinucleotide biosynthesis protein A